MRFACGDLKVIIAADTMLKVEIDNVASEFSCWRHYGSGPSDNSSDVEEPEAPSVGWGACEDGAAMSSSCEGNLG
jgi:hypothetical protein